MKSIINKISDFVTSVIQLTISRITKLMLVLFCSIEVEGLSNIKDSEGPLIYAMNHAHEIDVVVITSALNMKKIPLFFVTVKGNRYSWKGWRKIIYNGAFFGFLGGRSSNSGAKNYEENLKRHIKLIKNKYSIAIFPEGRRTQDGFAKEARGGVSYLSYKTKTPVVPVGISGVFRMTVRDFILRRRKLKVKIGKPINLWEALPQEHEPEVDDFRYSANRLMQAKIVPLIEDINGDKAPFTKPAKA